LDLAIENFPALPSSPEDNDVKICPSLKDDDSSPVQKEQAPENALHKGKGRISESCREDQSPELSLSEGLTTSYTDCYWASSNDTLSHIPKMSYAEMAQKPNKPSLCRETCGNDENDMLHPEIKDGSELSE